MILKVYSINFSSMKSIQFQVLNQSYLDIQCLKIGSVQNTVPFIQWRLIDFIENRYCKMAWNTENSMKGYLTIFAWVFWVLLLFISMLTDWIIKRFSEVAKTNDIYILGTKHIVFVIKVIKNLSKVFMQQYNCPELIWIKQNVSFACSNYRSNWQLIEWTEPYRNSEKKNHDHWTAVHRNFSESFHL